ncbi:hypothetical protein BEN47_06080 [Hymenobacter lapidarius]|uniref:Uncharacterized protein n=1 Tax=Hymenobacter lapidarius TaxID=1908237 RepID=A0A1G1SQC7_9BACT|nr:hypothetical protein [Hymenobacter lapidarius]OGX80822.1 hypothetical protein BEN47_06080 [Hymenobacter lapidarius]
MNLAEAIARAAPRLLGNVTHPDYQRTVDYAAFCKKLETGQIATLLQPFVARESPAEFAARLNLTVSTLPAVWNELRTPFKQVSRLKGSQVERRFDYAGLSDAAASRNAALLQTLTDGYYHSKPLEDYLADHVVGAVAMSDPNAWLLTEFGAFDFRRERARPYPVLLPSSAVVDFTRQAGNITSVTARVRVSTPNGTAGWRYTVYLANESVDYWPVLSENGTTLNTMPEGATVAGTVLSETGSVAWQYRILEHRAGRVPASPLGYALDAETEGRTYVSPLHPAICFLVKSLHLDSELDINLKRTIHPHKSMFVPPCPAMSAGACVAGKDPSTQQTCGVCHGTQRSPVQESALEVVTFPLPRDLEELGKMPDLSKMVHFERPPIEVAEFQLKFTDYLVARAQRTLFNTDTLSKATLVTTATERLAEAAQKNTALAPMGDFISGTYTYHAAVIAGYNDIAAGLVAVYKFPYELVAPELSDLIAVYDGAAKAGLDAMFMQELYIDITRRKLADNPEKLRRFTVKQRFVSYIGLSDEHVLKLWAMNAIPTPKFLLRTEQDSIFYELERATPGFYDLAPQAQQDLVDAKVAALVAELSSTGAARPGAFVTPTFSAAPVAATA